MLDRAPRRPLSIAEQEARVLRRLREGKKPVGKMTRAGDLLAGFWRQAGVAEDRIAILHAVWPKEVGGFGPHWTLEGVNRGTLHIRARSSASAQELALRSAELIRSLNKHFRTAWIKRIRYKTGA